MQTLPFPEDGALLICSDGLWGVVAEQTMQKIVSTTPDLPVACQLLTEAANEAGGPDNISVILVKMIN
jgi:protein phosphatase